MMIARLDVIGPLPTQDRRCFAKWYFVLLKKKNNRPSFYRLANADEYEDGTWHGLSRVKVIRDVNGFRFCCALLASCDKQTCVLKGKGGGARTLYPSIDFPLPAMYVLQSLCKQQQKKGMHLWAMCLSVFSVSE